MKNFLLTCLIPLLSLPSPVPLISPSIHEGPGIEAGRPMSIAERRAEEYRRLYEFCGEHHDCINLTARNRTSEKEYKQKLNLNVKLILHPIYEVNK